MLKQAIWIIQHNIYKKQVHCNGYFKRLPKGRSFDDVWDDASIWINYDPRFTGNFYGATSATDTDITIYEDAFRRGYWWVAGTIVHELAHTNGASAATIAAETALKFCGLGAMFDPGAVDLHPRSLREDDDRVV